MIFLSVDPTAIDAMVLHAARGGADEVCGFLVGERTGERVRVRRAEAATNDSSRPRTRYRIHARELLELEDRLTPDEVLVGVYHSHPDGPAVPSPADLGLASGWPKLVQAILPGGGAGPRFYVTAGQAAGALVECRVRDGALLSSAGS